ncbi:hypothetical protein GUJ93_ZPchr0004g40085 [Zizania palustris]|uniref:Uncharacterized protein n=1 Tax=Zizania palustris TaxID=103762 RepID=A0A8J5SNP8_ZIZPA|nr:hypothetical protein GUJ93_ZPchr0004g40085 [Zizania palustris]
MGRSPCCCHDGSVRRGPWSDEEDTALVEHIQRHGGHVGSWRSLPKAAGLNRCGKSCRLRWTNYLRPDIKRGNFSDDEEGLIIRLHAALGNRWSTIATHLEGRTDNEIKNYWNTHIKKKLLRMGVDPVTHQRLPPDLLLLDGAAAGHHLAPPAVLSPEAALLSAAASLGSLDTTLRQVHLLQNLLNAITSNDGVVVAAAARLMASNLAATTNATTTNSNSIAPNFQEQMNMLAHTNYQLPDYLRDTPSFAGQDMAAQQLNSVITTSPVLRSSAGSAESNQQIDQSCSAADQLVPAETYPQEVAAAVDRPVQDLANLEEPLELPNLCSLEFDPFWKDILESNFSL